MTAQSAAEWTVVRNTHASLLDQIRVTETEWRLENFLASDVRRALQQDSEIVTIQLRQGVEFMDGTAMTVGDVASSIRWVLDLLDAYDGMTVDPLDSTTIQLTAPVGLPEDFETRVLTLPYGIILPDDYARPSPDDLQSYRKGIISQSNTALDYSCSSFGLPALSGLKNAPPKSSISAPGMSYSVSISALVGWK